MVARPGSYQASNNAGELKPEIHGRTDIKQFYAGLALALNIEPVPQGGSRISPRTRHLGRVRRILAALSPISSSVALGPHSTATVIATVNFNGEPMANAVTISGFSASIGLGAILQVEWSNGTAWFAFGQPFTAEVSNSTRTVALSPGQSVAIRAVRLRMVSDPPSAVTFTLNTMIVASETAALPNARLRPFTFSLDQTYVTILTVGKADFYRDGSFVGTATTNFTNDQLGMIDTQQRFDTMLLFHEDQPPQRILRDGADNQWNSDEVPSENIPQVDLGGTYTNFVNDIWKIYFRYPTSGSTFNNGANLFLSISVNGEETPGLATGGTPNWTTFAADVKAALEELPSLGAGITVTESHATAGLTILTIEFTGTDNQGTNNAVVAQVVNTAEAAATSTHTQLGKPGGEDLMSEARGWPACAMFYQDRLVEGGFKPKKSAMLASVTGEYFDQNIDIASAAGAILVNLDTDGSERIQKFARSRHLVIFTSDAEYFVSDRILSKTAPPTIVNSSRNGSAPGVPIVESEGSLLYVSRNNALIFAATYDDVSTSYVSEPISLLASHIASDIVDMALQKPSTATDAGRLWMVRSDGTVCIGIMLRNQDVTAFVRWQTAGLVKSVCVDGKNVPHLLVERTVAGQQELHFERLELGLLFDGTVEQTFDAPTRTVTGLDVHEGAEVWALVDGFVEGPFTVAAGKIELAEEANHVMVGRWTAPNCITLPLPSEITEKVVLRRPKRVHTVRLDLVDTTSLAVGANGRPAKDHPLYRAGGATDVPLAPVTRMEPVTGLVGFSDEGQVQITQVRPGQLAWRGITIEARK